MKLKSVFYIIFAAGFILITGCDRKYSIDTEMFSQSMQDYIDNLDSTQQAFMEKIYPEDNILPVWYNSPADFRIKYVALREFLDKSLECHGINPALFNTDSIHRLFLSIDSTKIDYNKLAKLDAMVSKSYYNYCKTMKFGYFNPRKIYPEEYCIDVRKADDSFIETTFEQPEDPKALVSYLNLVQPSGKLYKKMQQKLISLYKERKSNPMFWIVAANMERERWSYAKDISHKHVWVNVATAQLRMMRGDSTVGTLKVGVGKSNEHETPLLIGDMYQIILNPTWTVPNSIVINEISKKGAGVTSYLARNNMTVYKNGIVQTPSHIRWDSISIKKQPYRIVQDSGATNSLGRVKFNFDNPYSIYLHDTNAKHIFNSDQRDVSHGCVRVSNPLKLAFFCLNDIDTTNKADVKKRQLYEDKMRYSIGVKPQSKDNELAIAKSGKNKLRYIKLDPRVTVIIEYRTCYEGLDGNLYFTPDYYDMDDILIKKLNNIPVKKKLENKPPKKEEKKPIITDETIKTDSAHTHSEKDSVK